MTAAPTNGQQFSMILNQLLRTRQFGAAKQMLLQALQREPSNLSMRKALGEILRMQPKGDSKPAIETLKGYETASRKLLVSKAAEGWLYSASVEPQFIEAAPPINSTPPTDQKQTESFSNTFHCELDALQATKDIAHRWQLVQQLATSEHPAMVADDFLHLEGLALIDALAAAQNGNHLNITILGAGCCGLALANMLKMAFGDQVHVLVIDKRVKYTHYKKPFTRNWLTHLRTATFGGRIDPRVQQLLFEFGEPGFLGCTIATLESLLFMSCRELGVKFLFAEQYPLEFLQSTNTQLVFDATGGRLDLQQSAISSSFVSADGAAVSFPSIKAYGKGFNGFGIRHIQNSPAVSFDLVTETSLTKIRPHMNNGPLSVPMVKLLGIPVSMHDQIMNYLETHNADGMFYLWQGKLCKPLNSMMLFANLSSKAFAQLSSVIGSSMPVSSALDTIKNNHICLDDRLLELLELISGEGLTDTTIEPPFVYQPYVTPEPQQLRCFGKQLMPVGDSIYNGNPKVGNGLGFHLEHLGRLVDQLILSYGDNA